MGDSWSGSKSASFLWLSLGSSRRGYDRSRIIIIPERARLREELTDMGRGVIENEAWVLETEPGQALLAEVVKVRSPGPADLSRWRKQATQEQVAAAIALAEARRRGALKFTRADQMWLERIGLEQATSEIVARHKARRFEAETVVDLCSGIGGDTIALAARSNVVAVDADPGMSRRLLWNAKVYGVGDRVTAVHSQAERFEIPAGAWVHVDPDRRTGTDRRAIWLDGYQPGVEFLFGLEASTAAGAIKVGPASDFAKYVPPSRFEVEVISLQGECKEATVWYGGLRTCERRATCLPDGATWTDRDGPKGVYSMPRPVEAWIYDTDPALRRASLVESFAQAHGLKRVAPGGGYLTAPERMESPFLTPFEVLGVHRLDMASLKREIARQEIGTLEVKVRGLDLRPEDVRKALKPRGERAATLLLAGTDRETIAVLARREPWTS
jgi:hypothetical protein